MRHELRCPEHGVVKSWEGGSWDGPSQRPTTCDEEAPIGLRGPAWDRDMSGFTPCGSRLVHWVTP